MKPQSAKAKGRLFQQWVRDRITESNGLHPDDVRSTSMGAGGEDILLSPLARSLFPYSIECKNVEKLNVYTAYAQADSFQGNYEPVLFMKKNKHKPLVVVDAQHFIELVKRANIREDL